MNKLFDCNMNIRSFWMENGFSRNQQAKEIGDVVKEDRHLSKRHVESIGFWMPSLDKCCYLGTTDILITTQN